MDSILLIWLTANIILFFCLYLGCVICWLKWVLCKQFKHCYACDFILLLYWWRIYSWSFWLLCYNKCIWSLIVYLDSNRVSWMENMTTFLNKHFTWLEVLKRSLPKQTRLQRNLPPPRQVLWCPFVTLLIIAKINNLGLVGDTCMSSYILDGFEMRCLRVLPLCQRW